MFGLLGPITGIILILLGGFLVFFFPGTGVHQPDKFAIVGIFMGLIFILIGVFLIFL